MNSFYKTGILLIIIAIPVFIFLFLKAFGKNNFTLPVYYEEGVASSLTECDFSGGLHTIPDFKLTSHNGEAIDQDVLNDKVTIVDFIFTSCPNICPDMSRQMKRVYEKYSQNSEVQILSFTVDPGHDDVEVLRQYAERLGVQSDQWKFLTGKKTDIYHLARCGFILPVQDGDGSPEDFIHSEKFVLVDGKKQIRGYYNGIEREDVDRLIMEIEILLNQPAL